MIGISVYSVSCATAPTLNAKNQAEFHYKKGVQALGKKNGPLAVAEFSECLSVASNHQRCLYEMGWAQLALWNWGDALVYWNTLRNLNPKFDGLAWAYSKLDNHFRIITEARHIRNRYPPHFGKKKKKRPFLRIHAVGDVMLGSDFPNAKGLPPDTHLPFEKVKATLQGAEIQFANLEGTFCDGGKTDKCKPDANCYAFRTPTQYASFIKDAGFNMVSLANNHIGDFGDFCMMESQKTMDGLGIAWSGAPGTFGVFEHKKKKIALAAFHTATHVNNLNDLKEARKFIQDLKKKNNLVIVSFHGGAEGFDALRIPMKNEIFYGEDRGNVVKFAHAMIDAGADLVLGHGPHVTRAMELYKGHLIAYSMGNFATYGTFNLLGFNSIGLVLEIDLDAKGMFRSGKIIPTRQRGLGIPEEDPRGMAIDLIRLLSEYDFPKTGIAVSQDGSLFSPRFLRKPRPVHWSTPLEWVAMPPPAPEPSPSAAPEGTAPAPNASTY